MVFPLGGAPPLQRALTAVNENFANLSVVLRSAEFKKKTGDSRESEGLPPGRRAHVGPQPLRKKVYARPCPIDFSLESGGNSRRKFRQAGSPTRSLSSHCEKGAGYLVLHIFFCISSCLYWGPSSFREAREAGTGILRSEPWGGRWERAGLGAVRFSGMPLVLRAK
ncbi:hypothetical protein GWK47_044106 [Chionoecetes opilio]|uniref:Uncharacterized protein n=1 Tax=Chionoecetes opilio TaxID=41210 RepID=A0A8J4YJJ3_CHIOP|nr:hypothetical protein GWK47_044106 [Chionoecetes opilio]